MLLYLGIKIDVRRTKFYHYLSPRSEPQSEEVSREPEVKGAGLVGATITPGGVSRPWKCDLTVLVLAACRLLVVLDRSLSSSLETDGDG